MAAARVARIFVARTISRGLRGTAPPTRIRPEWWSIGVRVYLPRVFRLVFVLVCRPSARNYNAYGGGTELFFLPRF